MVLSDNETKLDLLNNRAIASTIVSVIEKSEEPITIGIHGDWGAGKSSILAMVEAELNQNLNPDDEIDDWDEEEEANWTDETDADTELATITVRFNSWQYQGFEDAKIALMSSIVTKLQNESKAYYKEHKIKGGLKKLKETTKNIWHSIDKLALAKKAVIAGASIATGTAPIVLVGSAIKDIKDTITDSEKLSSAADSAIQVIKQSTSTESSNSYKEMQDFRRNFQSLFEEAHTAKLVVLIDDLDRCLPNVAIETLEAIRLFMFLPHTAFVIAADESMIRYSVNEHFPKASEIAKEDGANNDGRILGTSSFADKYLEKIIQVPFRIPRIGIPEARLYIMLLLIESEIGETEEYRELVDFVIKKLQTPWAVELPTTVEIKNMLGEEQYGKVVEKVIIAKNIDKILAENTLGNPRNIKRFINTLLLRRQIAEARGIKGLRLDVLAKMMLAEQYNNDFYTELATELDENGSFYGFAKQEKIEEDKTKQDNTQLDNTEPSESVVKTKRRAKTVTNDKAEKETKPAIKNEKLAKYFNEDWVQEWIEIEPSLDNEDLRPYYFACKEKIDFFFKSADEKVREFVPVVLAGAFATSKKKQDIEKMQLNEVKKLFGIASQEVARQDLTQTDPPKGIDGLRTLVVIRTELQGDLVNFLLSLDTSSLGIWAANGWDECIPKDSSSREKLKQFIDRLAEINKNPMVMSLAKKYGSDM